MSFIQSHPVDGDPRLATSNDDKHALETIEAELAAQNQALERYSKSLKGVAPIELGVPDSFFRELAEVCRFRPAAGHTGLQSVRC